MEGTTTNRRSSGLMNDIVIGMSFYICLPNFVVIERLAAELHCYDVISIFQDGGNRVENVLPGSGLVTGSA